jgi:hypothetical protein
MAEPGCIHVGDQSSLPKINKIDFRRKAMPRNFIVTNLPPGPSIKEWGPVIKASVIFIAVGYVIFGTFRYSDSIQNDNAFIQALTELLPAFREIDRVSALDGGDPVAMKIFMLYVFAGSAILSVWNICWSIKPDIRKKALARCAALPMRKWEMFVYVLFFPLLLSLLWVVITNLEYSEITWGVLCLYSSRFGPATQYLFLGASIAWGYTLIPPVFIHIFFNHRNSS